MEQACKKAAGILEHDENALLDAIEQAIMVLERHPTTNAGHGSNLTMDGTVECDASIMDGSGSFGAVGAVPGIHYPIQAAKKLAVDSKTPLPHGLIRPMMLVGDAARCWAINNGIEAESNPERAKELHKTAHSERKYKRYMDIIHQANKGAEANKRQKILDNYNNDDFFLDTVGCVVVNTRGHVAAGVSSGGIWMKTPGRVGEAALYGAGCWAQDDDSRGVAVSVSGAGEYIMKNLVGRGVASHVLTQNESMKKQVPLSEMGDGSQGSGGGDTTENASWYGKNLDEICASYLQDMQKRSNERNTSDPHHTPWECGVLCVTAQVDEGHRQVYVDMCTAHITCSSMAFGYYAPGSGYKSMISRKDGNDNGDADADDINNGVLKYNAVKCCTFGTSWEL